MGRQQGSKAARRQGIVEHWTIGSLSHTSAQRSFLCNHLRQYPSSSGLLLFLKSDQIDLPRLATINSPHHHTLAQHHSVTLQSHTPSSRLPFHSLLRK
jgi:hypothetical protein